MRDLSRLKQDRSGSVAIVFGLVLPVLICAIAASIDYGLLVHRSSQLQNAADAGALAAARELSLARPNSDGVATLARSIILSIVPGSKSLSVDSRVVGPSVEVALRETIVRMFGGVLGSTTSELVVRATARVATARL